MNFNLFYDYAKETGCICRKDEPLSGHTSFRVGGPCPVLCEPSSAEMAVSLINFAKKNNIPFIILGNGTNVLALDEGLQKVVIKIGDAMSSVKFTDNSTISCSAGTKLVTLCMFALENSLTGLEFAYGIPGTCGGAVYMNAGAYGGEVKDVLKSITHLTPDGEIETIPAEKADLGYRHSIYKENECIILSAEFTLTKGDKAEIKATMDDIISRRKDKQPLEYPSAGSTFKRPEGYFAGALIEQCELKGFSVGGAQVSEKHAGFVINKGGATANDITELISHIQSTVKSQTGVDLEPEVIILR